MNPQSTSTYSKDFGLGTPLLEITQGRDCRLWPYVQAPDCNKKINQCKSQAIYGFPAAAYQGSPVHYRNSLSGEKCSLSENYATLFPRCKRCVDSARVNGSGCKCLQG